jgi:hypothetical protein
VVVSKSPLRCKEDHPQVRFRDVQHSVPCIEALGREYFVVLGQSPSYETFFQVVHVGSVGAAA